MRILQFLVQVLLCFSFLSMYLHNEGINLKEIGQKLKNILLGNQKRRPNKKISIPMEIIILKLALFKKMLNRCNMPPQNLRNIKAVPQSDNITTFQFPFQIHSSIKDYVQKMFHLQRKKTIFVLYFQTFS